MHLSTNPGRARPLLPAALAAACAAALLAGCAGSASPARVTTGYASQQVCSAVFVGGADPDAYLREAVLPMATGFGWLLHVDVDRERQTVRATLGGLAESRAANRPPDGCRNTTDDADDVAHAAPVVANAARAGAPAAEPAAASATPDPWPALAAPSVVAPPDPALAAALAGAFDENPNPPFRHTKAVVVVHHDRLIAERYAAGVGPATPLHGWSASKSVTNALLGALVRDGRLRMDAPAPLTGWADPADPRHRITPDDLLRMRSGLDVRNAASPGAWMMFETSARMSFVEADMAGYAQRVALADPPGTRWAYSDVNTLLLSRVVRDLAGGDAASFRAYARRELFEPLGMRGTTFELDATGTPVGSAQVWAPARDWARLGLLFLHDGMAGAQRVLPQGWTEMSATPTPGSETYGYGAGFWTERGDGAGARFRVAAGLPADSYMARGNQGQYVVIVPSEDLVVVRLGSAWTPRDDLPAVARLVRETIAALHAPG